ncbi:MAG: GAF domain-containing protein [Nitrospinaceae bacterium]|nr:GAF domain-containing protein [Nitrospina sp.]MBT5868219.1 GAF domain-containing protein [Nitrospinaceae bacterium]
MAFPPLKHDSPSRVTEEYQVLHKVAQILQSKRDLEVLLYDAMQAITGFSELKVENKAGIFLADEKNRVLRLLITYGDFSQEFLEKEKEIPFGDCLCGRVAVSGELLMSESCFSDARHERIFSDMKAHGHYIVPLKSQSHLIGVMFLYTDTSPSWYQHSQEVLISIGGLIADTIQRKQVEKELNQHRQSLESLVSERTQELSTTNKALLNEIEGHEQTHKALLSSQEQLRNLGHQIQTVREEEKSRISREVHDELGQALTRLKIDLIHLTKNSSDESIHLREQVQSMVKIVDNTIKSVQRIATELRPPILDAFGICDAIEWQASEYAKKLGLRFDLQCLQEQVRLEKDLQTCLFRVFQETLTNIVRHANASRVGVSLSKELGMLTMEIRDNGNGIKNEDLAGAESLGLIGIRERVHFWNGEVCFRGSPGKGTVVTVKIPIKDS